MSNAGLSNNLLNEFIALVLQGAICRIRVQGTSLTRQTRTGAQIAPLRCSSLQYGKIAFSIS